MLLYKRIQSRSSRESWIWFDLISTVRPFLKLVRLKGAAERGREQVLQNRNPSVTAPDSRLEEGRLPVLMRLTVRTGAILDVCFTRL